METRNMASNQAVIGGRRLLMNIHCVCVQL